MLLALLTLQRPTHQPWELAFERDGNIYQYHEGDKKSKLLLKHATNPTWAPDRRRMAFVRNKAIWIHDFKTGVEHRIATLPKPAEYYDVALNFDPNQNVLLWSADWWKDKWCPGIHAVDLETKTFKQELLLSRWRGFSTLGPSWSPSGSILAFCRNGDVWIVKRDGIFDPGMVTSDLANYLEAARRISATAEFYDSSGGSASTPNFADQVEWSGNERRLYVHLQRMGGSGVSKIGYIDYTAATADAIRPPNAKVNWIIDNALEMHVCPDGQTLSYVTLGDDGDHPLVIQDPSQSKFRYFLASVDRYSWRPNPK